MIELLRVYLDCILIFVWIQMLIHVQVERPPIVIGEWMEYK